MIKLSLELDVNLIGFVGLSAVAAAVFYLSSRNKKLSNVKGEDPFSSKGKNKGGHVTVDKTEEVKQTHVEKEKTPESKSDKRNFDNDSFQYAKEASEKQIFFDKDKSLNLSEDGQVLTGKYEGFSVSRESQTLDKIPQNPDANATHPKETTNPTDSVELIKGNTAMSPDGEHDISDDKTSFTSTNASAEAQLSSANDNSVIFKCLLKSKY